MIILAEGDEYGGDTIHFSRIPCCLFIFLVRLLLALVLERMTQRLRVALPVQLSALCTMPRWL